MGSFGNPATSREQHRKVNSIVMVMKELQSRSSKFPTATKGGQALSISSFKLARLHTCTVALEWNQLLVT